MADSESQISNLRFGIAKCKMRNAKYAMTKAGRPEWTAKAQNAGRVPWFADVLVEVSPWPRRRAPSRIAPPGWVAWPQPARCGGRRCVTMRLIVVLVLGLVAAGCGHARPAKPVLFRVCGRVLDADTKEGLAQARLLLQASIPTGAGSTTLKTFGATGADGKYDVELSEGFQVLQYASQIRLSVAKQGYGSVSVDVPIPAKASPFYPMGDIVLARAFSAPSPVPPVRPRTPGAIFRDSAPRLR